MLLCIFFIVFFTIMTFAMGFLSTDLWKDLSDPYKYDNTFIPRMMLTAMSIMGVIFFLITGYFLLQLVKIIAA